MKERWDCPNQCSVDSWLEKIKEKKIAIPSFQRAVVWKDETIADLFHSISNGKPVGTLLLLKCDENSNPPFDQKNIEGAPCLDTNYTPDLIVDGQQRLTALWRGFNDAYDSPSPSAPNRLFARIEETHSGLQVKHVEFLRPSRFGDIFDSPQRAWGEGWIPISILGGSGESDHQIMNWCLKVYPADSKKAWKLSLKLVALASSILHSDISYYLLPKETNTNEVISIFIKTNTSSAKITGLDVAVARTEQLKRIQLRSKAEELKKEEKSQLERFLPSVKADPFKKLGELLFKIACLLADADPVMTPTEKNYSENSVISALVDNWNNIIKGIVWTFDLLEDESIYDQKRLPSVVPLRVVPALHAQLYPDERSPDLQGQFRKLIVKYLWRAFVTNRYEKSANTRLKEDFVGLKEIIEKKGYSNDSGVPIFDEKSYPIPTKNQLASLSSPIPPPTGKNSLSRSLLIVSLRKGAQDLASGDPLRISTIGSREYHHVFPQKLLEEDDFEKPLIDHALNFGLILGTTNRKLAAKPPIKYLEQRIVNNVNKSDIRKRLESHAIPYEKMNVENGQDGRYKSFIECRAETFAEALKNLCAGEHWPN